MGNYPTNESSKFIDMRFWTRDYEGLVIVHCHLLQHEDNGLMGFYGIIPDLPTDPAKCPNREDTPSLSPTEITPSPTEEADVTIMHQCIISVIVCFVTVTLFE